MSSLSCIVFTGGCSCICNTSFIILTIIWNCRNQIHNIISQNCSLQFVRGYIKEQRWFRKWKASAVYQSQVIFCIQNEQMKTTSSGKYLGDIINNTGKLNKNIQARVNKATGTVNTKNSLSVRSSLTRYLAIRVTQLGHLACCCYYDEVSFEMRFSPLFKLPFCIKNDDPLL